ncbi:FACT complex subunit POB3 [Spizellomyces punctatus DAOM BR117]|uniref:FACT complex subunit POB3 n=1 Tax=Spizellomyces punctatus (strain DAOM BR117) TaxID=645134 RepID=A0A0L0HKY8_SPIPD|nr:FACT complex subunit POB3 [Spizellomyces punctatus DAOM BR117]KND01708.1 hypothetical protein SPPG_03502 [Spizellomyces punctatus DAOM BR117]|eukprot:XP_016609747.1 hypothetical protein SPPG_03502 [Spizellomyces punctatus DAOM BR117]
MAREFETIYLGGKITAKGVGRLKIAEAGIGWKNAANGKVTAVPAAEIQKLSWQRCAREFQLRVQQKDGTIVKFDGFPRDTYDTLAHLIKNLYHKTLERKELSVRGWNWGSIEFQGNNMSFNVANHPAFEIPLNEVANATLASRNEVSVEFAGSDGDPKSSRGEDALVEVRFFVPGVGTQSQVTQNEDGIRLFKDKDEEGDIRVDDGVDDEPVEENGEKPVLDEDGSALSSASLLCETIKQKSDFGGAFGESIASFENLLCLTPRGRFEVDMHADFFRLRGKSHDYKVLYDSVIMLALLPKPDDLHFMLVVGLDPPLRQGQTRYPFLVFQFEREDEMEISLAMDDETLTTTYANRLKKDYDGPIYEVVSDILKGLSGKKLTTPGGTFRSNQNQSGIKCAYKANEAFLYPLEKLILSIPKPAIYFSHNDIAAVTFARVGQAGGNTLKTFEIKFNLRDGPEYTFSSIAREEHDPLMAYFRAKKIQVLSELVDTGVGYVEDSDIESEEEPVRKRSRDEGDGYEDEDESEDEDFAPEDESDVAEEYDEQYAGSSDEEGAAPDGANEKSDASDNEDSRQKPKGKVKPEGNVAKKEDKSKQPAKKKAKKDAAAPKKNVSAFLLFCKDKRPEVMDENPGLSITEASKKLGELWKSITPDEKKKYDNLASEDKERYERERKVYEAGGGGSSSKGTTSASGSKSKGAPSASGSKSSGDGKYKSAEFVDSDED